MESAQNDIPMGQRYAFEDTSAQSNKTVVNDAGKAAQSIFNRAGAAVEKSAAGNAAKAGIGTAIGDIAAGPLAAVTAYFGDITPLGNVEDGKSPNGDRIHIDGPAGSIRITYDNRSIRDGRVGDNGNSWYDGNRNLIAQRNSAGQLIIASPGEAALQPNPKAERYEPVVSIAPDISPDILNPPTVFRALPEAVPRVDEHPPTDTQKSEMPVPATQADGAGGKQPPGSVGAVRPDGECDENASVGPQSPRTRLPDKNGHWLGEPGNSGWQSIDPEINAVTGGKPISFVNNRPDFTPWSKMSINFPVGVLTGHDRTDQKLARQALDTADNPDVKAAGSGNRFMNANRLTAHHATDTCLQLVPKALNGLLPHIGAASDIRYQGSIGWKPLP